MAFISKKELARMAGVSSPTITQAVKRGRLPIRADGKINTEDPVILGYIQKQKAKKAGEAKGTGIRPPANPAPPIPKTKAEAPGKKPKKKKTGETSLLEESVFSYLEELNVSLAGLHPVIPGLIRDAKIKITQELEKK